MDWNETVFSIRHLEAKSKEYAGIEQKQLQRNGSDTAPVSQISMVDDCIMQCHDDHISMASIKQ